MWFQQNECQDHFSRIAREALLNQDYLDHWMNRVNRIIPVAWSPRLPDLTQLNSF